MKVAILVCAMTVCALAAPRYNRVTRLDPRLSEHVKAAEQAWAAAEREPDLVKQSVLWERAADAFAQVDGDSLDTKVKREAAYAAVLAWRNALAVDPRTTNSPKYNAPVTPRPLPARELKLVGAIDRYLKHTDPADGDMPGLLLIKAQTFVRFDQLQTAIPIYRTIVDRHPQHETAGFAALFALDSYNRLAQYDEMIAFADALAKNTKLLRDRADLAATVAQVQRQIALKRVHTLEVAARADADLEKYAAAGTAYLELYNRDPQAPDGDELLYNAGVTFEASRTTTAAIQAFTLLQRRYPNSRLVARSVGRLGQLYATVAMYDKAAEQLEQYAMKYSGEKDAYSALSNAVYYRRALGDRDKAIANTNYFIRSFGPRKPREAANAMWSLTSVYETDPDRAVAHLRAYLRSYGAKGGAERVVIAHAKIGQLRWKQSCPISGVDGLCVKPSERVRTCGIGMTRALTAIPRDPGKRAEALVAFASAIKEHERGALTNDEGARYYHAQAKLALADAELEPYFAVAMPRGLDFDPKTTARTASLKRFSEWIEQKHKTGGELTRQYEAIISLKDAATSITAAARLGLIPQSFASSLATSEVPRGARNVYCTTMTAVAEPLEATAVNAFAFCLAKSTEVSWFGESSRQCERELIRMKPAEFPRASELRFQPVVNAPMIELEPPPR